MTSTETAGLGVSTKWKVLSAGRTSVPARTTPRTTGSARVNWLNAADPEALGPTVSARFSISCPSTSSETGTAAAASALRFVTPAVTVMRSWPENEARAKVTDGTERFVVLPVAIGTGLSVMPSPKWTSSAPLQPARWKSEMRIASRRGSVDRVRMLSASFSAGP